MGSARIAGIALAVSLCLPFVIPARSWAQQQDSPKETAMELARRAKRAENAGHNSEAFVLYSEALAIQPNNKGYRRSMVSVKARADAEQRQRAETAEMPNLPSESPFDSLTAEELAAERPAEPSPELAANAGVQDFDLNGTARSLFEQVARRFGLAAAYDSDYPAAGPQIRFHVNGADYRNALHDLEAATNSFVTPLSAKIVLIATDTPQKRTDLERTETISIPIPTATTQQELTEITQAVRQALNIEKIGADTAQTKIVIRDRISRVRQATVLLDQLLWSRSEAMIEVEFIEVAKTDLINYGFNVTNMFTATYLGQILNNVVSYPTGVTNLLIFGNGKTLIGLGVAQVQAMFNENLSTSKTLFRAQQRAVDGQAATFHVGERYPIITSQYAGQVSPAQQGQVYSPPPAFTYQDLGVEVKVTPRIHGDSETTLTIDTSYQLLTGTSVNSLPIIGRQELNTSVRLKNDEWAVVAGLMNPVQSKAVTGFWGLAQIPLIGNLFKQVSKTDDDTEILIVIKADQLSLPADQIVSKVLRVGSDTRPFNNF